MASAWGAAPLGELVEDILDRRGVTPIKLGSDFVSAGHRVISAKLVKSGRIDLGADEPRFVDEATYRKWMRTPLLAEDVIVTSEAPLGEVAYLAVSNDWVLGQRLFAIRTNNRRLLGRFLYYALQSQTMIHELQSRATGTTAQGIRQSELRHVKVPLPPLDEQRRVAAILGALDDKIELNRRMNETLEATARALFKSWFVDFDPVRAKAEGRDPGLPRHLADLFPDSLEDSELGEIPKGWKVGQFGDVAEHPRRGVQPDAIDASTPYIALEHMPRSCIALSEWGVADGVGSNKFEFRRGEILFGKLRPYFHKVGVAPLDGACSTDIVVVKPRQEDWFGLVLGHVSSDAFVEYTSAGSTGTKMPRTSWGDMARYPVVLPSSLIARAFSGQIHPSVARVIAAIHESRTLAGVRDTLLPMLISGELRLRDVERMAEGVSA
jgi:type I restriction enzyme S subunit